MDVLVRVPRWTRSKGCLVRHTRKGAWVNALERMPGGRARKGAWVGALKRDDWVDTLERVPG